MQRPAGKCVSFIVGSYGEKGGKTDAAASIITT
jgi:hypothetical protein